MSPKPVTRKGSSATLPIDAYAMNRRAWAVAARARRAVQHRIVVAFGRHVEGSGPGPTDAELQQFARLAVAEQRLGRRLASLELNRCFGNAQAASGRASVLRRGEQG